MRLIENGVIERNGEELIRTAGRVGATVLTLDHVIQKASVRVPKLSIERALRAVGMLLQAICFAGATRLSQPAFQEAESVVPERVDLNRFATPRRHHPIVNFGVHPCELIAFLSLDQEVVSRVHMNVEASSTKVVADDVEQVGNQLLKQVLIVHMLQITMDSMKEPERGIRRVIQTLRFTFGEHVGDEPVTYVVGKGSEDIAGFDRAPRGHGETFETDHGVTTPVCKPVVTGDDTSNLITCRASPGGILAAAYRGKDKLIGGPDKFLAVAGADGRVGLKHQPAFAIVLGIPGLLGSRGRQNLPNFSGGDQSHTGAGGQFGGEIARSPEIAAPGVSTIPFHLVQDVRNGLAVNDKRRFFAQLEQ